MSLFLIFVGFTVYLIYREVRNHCDAETYIAQQKSVSEYLGK